MKNSIKIISGAVVSIVVLGTLALLAIKYFDVLLRVFDNVKENFKQKKFGIFSDECCDFFDESESDEIEEA